MNLTVRALIGSGIGFAYLLVEAIGMLLVVKTSNQEFGVVEAGLVANLFYIFGLFNVFTVCYGTMLARGIARSDEVAREALAKEGLAKTRVVGVAIAAILAVALFSSLMLGSSNLTLPAIVILSIGFASGWLFRSLGLVAAFSSVGRGDIGADKRYQLVFSMATYVTLLTAVLLLHLRPVVAAAWSVVLCGFLQLTIRRGGGWTILTCISGPVSADLRGVFRHTSQYLVTGATGYLVVNGDAIVVGISLGPKSLTDYLALSKLILGVFSLSGLPGSVLLPYLSAASAAKDRNRYRHLTVVAVGASLFLTLCGIIVSVMVYPSIQVWATGGDLLPPTVVTVGMLNGALLGVVAAVGWPLLATSRTNLALPTAVDAAITIIGGFTFAYSFGMVGIITMAILAHVASLALQWRVAVVAMRDFAR